MEKRFNDIVSNFREVDLINNDLRNNNDYNFKNITCSNKLTLIKASAKFARDIYYESFIDEIDPNRINADDITDVVNNVKAYSLYDISKPNDIIILIRGSVGWKNWKLNIVNCGNGLLIKFVINVTFLFTALFLYRKFVFADLIARDSLYFPDWLSYETISDSTSNLLGKNIDVFHSALPIILFMILLTLFFNLLWRKFYFVHDGFDKCADKIIENLNKKVSLNSIDRIFIIGHSLAGGVTELTVKKLNETKKDKNKCHAEIRGIVFNSAPGQNVETNGVLYIFYGMDALTLFNQIFIRIVGWKLKIPNKFLETFMKKLSYLLAFLIIGLIICIKFESVGPVGMLNKMLTLFSSFLLLYFYPFITDKITTSFKSNHLMDNLINEIDT